MMLRTFLPVLLRSFAAFLENSNVVRNSFFGRDRKKLYKKSQKTKTPVALYLFRKIEIFMKS